MIKFKNRPPEGLLQSAVPDPNEFEQVARNLCEEALTDAKARLHPLLRSVELDHLDHCQEFLEAFKLALEQRIAQQLAHWQPDVQAVFKFDAPLTNRKASWDGSIHLLVRVSRLSNTVIAFAQMLDQNLVKCLKRLGWSRFRTCQSILEVQQVTPNELRRGLSCAAMFCAVYTVPVKVWSRDEMAC